MTQKPQVEVAIIGAGFSGIGVAIALKKAGLSDFCILEAGDGVGGAWHWNTYPGVGVDIPSFSYQFSFYQRSDWSRVYAPGRELKQYAEDCVAKFGLQPHLRFNISVDAARFDEAANVWVLDTAQGESITARHVVSATGVFSQPNPPAIPGVEDFAGITMHTARWDHSVDLRGKRVGIIGTGASAVQVIPSIAPDVESLSVFQRTPIWCLPKPDARLMRPVQAALRRLPGLNAAARALSQTFVEATFPFAAHYNGLLPVATAAEKIGHAYLKSQVKDPDVRDKLTPRYSLGCKRPSFSNAYLATFNRDNVRLETNSIEHIAADGIHTADGQDHALDVLILATGFKVFEKGNLPPFAVVGRNQQELGAYWERERFQAYEGASVPGFPNFFTVLGPYAYNGSSYFTLIENQSRHIVRCLRAAKRKAATRVEVREQAQAKFFADMLKRRPRQIFYRGSCGTANSYYFDAHGDVPFRPATTLEAAWRSATFPLSDYQFSKT